MKKITFFKVPVHYQASYFHAKLSNKNHSTQGRKSINVCGSERNMPCQILICTKPAHKSNDFSITYFKLTNGSLSKRFVVLSRFHTTDTESLHILYIKIYYKNYFILIYFCSQNNFPRKNL